MEYIDVLDENGNKTNIVRNKQLIYKKGDWHRTVHVWIMNSRNELLIQKRAIDKETFAGLWAISVAGHVRSGETSLAAAKREIKEEIDIDIRDNDLKYLFSLKRKQPCQAGILNVHDDVYLLRLDLDITNVSLQIEEVTEVRYINYKEFENYLINNDPRFVPYCDEHKMLFEYLRNTMNLE